MDMSISGKVNIPSGEYNKITVSGSVRLYGDVECEDFSATGAVMGEKIDCEGIFKLSGIASFSEGINAESIDAWGKLSCKGDLTANKSFSISGSARIAQGVKCEEISVKGELSVDGDIEAESFFCVGAVNCSGHLKSENVKIRAEATMQIDSVDGGNILIKRRHSSLVKDRRIIISKSIEGERIELEYVTCPRVSGRTVVIGKGCDIGLVQYIDKISVSQNATISNLEKQNSISDS